LAQHGDLRDEQGRRLVVRNGSLTTREILTGAGPVEVRQGRVRDNSPQADQRVQFTPSVLPAYLRRSGALEELIPWLYLKGVSTGDFQEALQALVGEKAKGLSPNVIVMGEIAEFVIHAWSLHEPLASPRFGFIASETLNYFVQILVV
jgi:transposase-like protein